MNVVLWYSLSVQVASLIDYHVYTNYTQTDPGHLETFQALLRDNPCVFHACRTATSLHHHWVLMGHYTLLNNQKGWDGRISSKLHLRASLCAW